MAGDDEELFPLGEVLVTPAAERLLREAGQDLEALLVRHRSGDWGEPPTEADREHNEIALEEGGYLLSFYPVGDKEVWVETSADRSVTTVMAPWEY